MAAAELPVNPGKKPASRPMTKPALVLSVVVTGSVMTMQHQKKTPVLNNETAVRFLSVNRETSIR